MAVKERVLDLTETALSDEDYLRAVEAGDAEPRAKSARYDRANARLVVEMQNGVVMMIPTQLLQGLQKASAKDLAAVELLADGYALHWPELNVDFTVNGLILGIFGTKQWMRDASSQYLSEAGRKGGSVTSRAKSAASRVNGKFGGRPKKKVSGERGV